MKEKIAVFPGSFDPLTFGHFDIVTRSLTLVDKLVIAVIDNPNKKCTFKIKERENMINELIIEKKLSDKIIVKQFKGLSTDFVKQMNAEIIIRGIRALSDFEFEFRAARMNKYLAEKIETIFILSGPEYEHISSSLIKEVHKLGGDVSYYLHKNILEKLKEKNY